MNMLFVADPLESFKTYKDTTFAMMREAQRRGHTLLACEPQDCAGSAGRSGDGAGARHHADRDARRLVRRTGPRAAPLPTSTRC
jgi:glutathione synthase